jgi:hypothetical protein
MCVVPSAHPHHTDPAAMASEKTWLKQPQLRSIERVAKSRWKCPAVAGRVLRLLERSLAVSLQGLDAWAKDPTGPYRPGKGPGCEDRAVSDDPPVPASTMAPRRASPAWPVNEAAAGTLISL